MLLFSVIIDVTLSNEKERACTILDLLTELMEEWLRSKQLEDLIVLGLLGKWLSVNKFAGDASMFYTIRTKEYGGEGNPTGRG